jgi:hypothetical protein
MAFTHGSMLWANLISRAILSRGVVTTMASGCLCERIFLSKLLLIKRVFSSYHRSFRVSSLEGTNNFLHCCANMAWTTKGTKSPPLLGLSPFSLIDINWYALADWWRFRHLVVPLPLYGSPLWGSFACVNFGSCALFRVLSPVLGAFLS